MNKDYINYMTFSHLCYILVRDKGTLVRVKLQVNQEGRNIITTDILEIIFSYSTKYMALCTIVLANFDDAAATSCGAIYCILNWLHIYL